MLPENQALAIDHAREAFPRESCGLLVIRKGREVYWRCRNLGVGTDQFVIHPEDYAKAGLPMLPVTHGEKFTRLSVLLYTIILAAVTLLPFATRMSGLPYLVCALVLDAVYLGYAMRLLTRYSDALARKAFRYSIVYLSLLFTALLLDHYLPF